MNKRDYKIDDDLNVVHIVYELYVVVEVGTLLLLQLQCFTKA